MFPIVVCCLLFVVCCLLFVVVCDSLRFPDLHARICKTYQEALGADKSLPTLYGALVGCCALGHSAVRGLLLVPDGAGASSALGGAAAAAVGSGGVVLVKQEHRSVGAIASSSSSSSSSSTSAAVGSGELARSALPSATSVVPKAFTPSVLMQVLLRLSPSTSVSVTDGAVIGDDAAQPVGAKRKEGGDRGGALSGATDKKTRLTAAASTGATAAKVEGKASSSSSAARALCMAQKDQETAEGMCKEAVIRAVGKTSIPANWSTIFYFSFSFFFFFV
jgi:hypothetical protein